MFTSTLLWLAISAVLVYGDRVKTTVEFFSLEEKNVSSYTKQMTFEFNRSVQKEEMEETFSMEPKVKTELSWVGKKMVVTFEEPLLQGQNYFVHLGDFSGSFRTREKEIFYVDGSTDKRQIFSYLLSEGTTEALTPEDLYVTDYQFTQNGDTIVFFATPKEKVTQGGDYSLFPNLYSMDLDSGECDLLLAGEEDALNMMFKLSPDGETILVNQLYLNEDGAPDGAELLISEQGGRFKPFWKQELTGLYQGALYFTSDSQFVVVHDWNRFKLIPVKEGSFAEQDLGTYTDLLGFTDAGNRLLFLNWKDSNPYALTNEVVVFDENGGQEIVLSDLGVLQDLEMSQDGKRSVFTMESLDGSKFGIYKWEEDTRQLNTLFEKGLLLETNLDLALDEEWLAFETHLDVSENGNGEVWILNVQTGESNLITAAGRLPKWRP